MELFPILHEFRFSVPSQKHRKNKELRFFLDKHNHVWTILTSIQCLFGIPSKIEYTEHLLDGIGQDFIEKIKLPPKDRIATGILWGRVNDIIEIYPFMSATTEEARAIRKEVDEAIKNEKEQTMPVTTYAKPLRVSRIKLKQ